MALVDGAVLGEARVLALEAADGDGRVQGRVTDRETVEKDRAVAGQVRRIIEVADACVGVHAAFLGVIGAEDGSSDDEGLAGLTERAGDGAAAARGVADERAAVDEVRRVDEHVQAEHNGESAVTDDRVSDGSAGEPAVAEPERNACTFEAAAIDGDEGGEGVHVERGSRDVAERAAGHRDLERRSDATDVHAVAIAANHLTVGDPESVRVSVRPNCGPRATGTGHRTGRGGAPGQHEAIESHVVRTDE